MKEHISGAAARPVVADAPNGKPGRDSLQPFGFGAQMAG